MEDKFCNYILALILIFLQQKIFQTMLTFQELMLVSHLILPWRQAFQPHFSNLCSHFRNICWCLISFQTPVSLILAIYAHILGSLCSHFRNICWCLISFQPPVSLILAIYAHILGSLCSHFRNICWCLISFQPPVSLILAIYAHILGSLCSHFRNICWCLISFQPHFRKSVLTFQEHILVSHLILASFQQSMLTFQEHMLVSHLILPPLGLILAIYAHILGTHAGLSSHFYLGDKHFSPFPSHFSWISFFFFFFCTFFGQIGRVSHLMSSLLHTRVSHAVPPSHLAHELIFCTFWPNCSCLMPDSWLVSQESRLQICPSFGLKSQISLMPDSWLVSQESRL